MRLHIPTSIRWSDLDAYGHVNNAAMFGLLEEARIHAFWAGDSGHGDDHLATRILEGGPTADTFTLIAHQEIEYLAPIPYMREPLDLQMWLGHVGGASLDVCYEIYSPTQTATPENPQQLFAKATTTIVLVDAKTTKPRRLTDVEREAIAPYTGENITFKRRS
ncbi:MAG: acyl-CoA thioesterase [Actinomycetales bacterium]|nr:acyl-CoA thioesterase [Actinomycetales bacterium]